MAKKRANGEGNIRKRKDGRWEGRYTAGYDSKTGKRIITEDTKKEMKKILEEIQDGTFASKWIAENKNGRSHFNACRRIKASHQLEEVGAELRKMYAWNDDKYKD